MGSKRTSSKNPTNVRSSPPPADGNNQNPKNPSLGTPSKPRKKPKLSAPISNDSSFLSPTPSTDGEAQSQNSNRKGKAPEASNKISVNDAATPRSGSVRWGEADILKLLKSVASFQAKSGLLIGPSNIKVLSKEIKAWAPGELSEKNLNRKLIHLRVKFQKSSKPGPDSTEFDRSFYELASMVWGAESLKDKSDATGGVERKGDGKGKKEKVSKKPKGEKKKVNEEKEDEDGVEEEERDSENDEGTDEKGEKGVMLENGEEQGKDKVFVDAENGRAGHSYKYLRLALEEFWTESKMNMDTLYAALPKVNHVQAKRLDEHFREVFVGMLKLKMEKNKVSNEIIRASLGC